MLIIALVLAVVGLAALVFAVVTSNALVAWVCIGASLLGVLLLIVDALRERRRNAPPAVAAEAEPVETVEYPEDESDGVTAASEDDDVVDDAAADLDGDAADEVDEVSDESADETSSRPAD